MNSLGARRVALREVLCEPMCTPAAFDGTFCSTDDEKAAAGDEECEVLMAILTSLSIERHARMKTSRGSSFFPGNIIILAALPNWGLFEAAVLEN